MAKRKPDQVGKEWRKEEIILTRGEGNKKLEEEDDEKEDEKEDSHLSEETKTEKTEEYPRPETPKNDTAKPDSTSEKCDNPKKPKDGHAPLAKETSTILKRSIFTAPGTKHGETNPKQENRQDEKVAMDLQLAASTNNVDLAYDIISQGKYVFFSPLFTLPPFLFYLYIEPYK